TTYVLVNGSPLMSFVLSGFCDKAIHYLRFLLAVGGLDVVFKVTVDVLFKCHVMGDKEDTHARVSHFQFADDTLITGREKLA
ncbi:hypothetical protein A2U01_0066051, partial [Trifolium medium]|nr:hypothetical protein [Trifolium medium]